MAKLDGHGSPSSPPEFTFKSMPLIYPKVPQQENGYDCGIFVMLFFEAFSKQKFPMKDLLSDKIIQWYDQAAALHLRRRIKDIIVDLGCRV